MKCLNEQVSLETIGIFYYCLIWITVYPSTVYNITVATIRHDQFLANGIVFCHLAKAAKILF